MYVSGTASATSDGADAHLVGPGALLALLQLGAVARRQQLDGLGADVVARARVLVAGIAEPHHQQVGGGAPSAASTGYSSPASSEASAAGASAPPRPASPSARFARFALLGLGDDPRRRDLRDDEVGLGLRAPRRSAAGCPRRGAGRRWRARSRRSRSTPGCCRGMASTVRLKRSCSSSPPSRTPVASPTRWTRDLGAHRDVAADADEVDVHQLAPRGVALDLAGEGEHALAVDVEGDQRVGAALPGEDVLQLAGRDGDRDRVGAEAVDDRGHLALRGAADPRGGSPARGAARRRG